MPPPKWAASWAPGSAWPPPRWRSFASRPGLPIPSESSYGPAISTLPSRPATRHPGAVVLPARPRKPRDKAAAEGSVLVAQRWILARLRDHAGAMFVIDAAAFGQPDLAGGAMHQLQLQPLLKDGNPAADIGFRHLQRFGRRGKAVVFHHGRKNGHIGESAGIHGLSIICNDVSLKTCIV